MAPGAWFSPIFGPLSSLADPAMAISYLGPTTWEGQSAYHIRFWRAAPEQGAAEAAQIARLSQADVYLDANTLLPLALT